MGSSPATAADRYAAQLASDPPHPADGMPDLSKVVVQERSKRKGKARRYAAGSTDVRVDALIGMTAMQAIPAKEDRDTRIRMVKQVMGAVKPRNELEGMLAAQMVAANAAAMDAYGRAMNGSGITLPVYESFLNQAAKASRTFATLLEALDRHRGKGGQQRVRVEHVHVYEGGQAIVGNVSRGPGADSCLQREHPP